MKHYTQVVDAKGQFVLEETASLYNPFKSFPKSMLFREDHACMCFVVTCLSFVIYPNCLPSCVSARVQGLSYSKESTCMLLPRGPQCCRDMLCFSAVHLHVALCFRPANICLSDKDRKTRRQDLVVLRRCAACIVLDHLILGGLFTFSCSVLPWVLPVQIHGYGCGHRHGCARAHDRGRVPWSRSWRQRTHLRRRRQHCWSW